jgi:hypothetical protein
MMHMAFHADWIVMHCHESQLRTWQDNSPLFLFNTPGNHGFSIGCIHEFRGQMGAGLFSMVGSVIHPQRRFQGDPRRIQLPSCTPQFGSIETHQDKY